MKKFAVFQRGFSLMEVTIAIGILSLGAYFLISTLKNSLSLQKARTVTSDITNILSDPVACLETFGGGDSSRSISFSWARRDETGNGKTQQRKCSS